MTETHQILDRAEAALRARFDALFTDANDDPPDKLARHVSSLLKALDDIAAQRDKLEAAQAAKTHTRYEDMPPPTPEDEARFYERYCKIVGLIHDARGTADPVGDAGGVGPSAIS